MKSGKKMSIFMLIGILLVIIISFSLSHLITKNIIFSFSTSLLITSFLLTTSSPEIAGMRSFLLFSIFAFLILITIILFVFNALSLTTISIAFVLISLAIFGFLIFILS